MFALCSWFKGLLPAVPAAADGNAQWVRLTQWRTGTLAVLAVAVWIAMAEVDRLIADAATPLGRSASASSLQSIDPRLGQENWGLWLGLPDDIRTQLCVLLGIYSGLDAILAILYIKLLYGFFSSKFIATLAVGAMAAGELTELILQAQGIMHLSHGTLPEILAATLIASSVKWAGLALLVLCIFVYADIRTTAGRAVQRAWKALFFHRISVIVIVVLGSLALLPIPGVNDQMPDTQRAWLDGETSKFAVTSAAALLVSAGLFYLGRRRSELAWSLYFAAPNVPNEPPKYWMWALPPALLGMAIAFVCITTGLAVPLGWQTVVAAGVPLAVSGLSWFLTLFGPGAPIVPRPTEPDRAVDAWRCGDVLAFVLLAVSGMALVRAFTAPIALGAAGALAFDASMWAGVGYLAAGVLTVALAFPVGALVVWWLWGGVVDPRVIAGAPTQIVTVILSFAFAGVGFVFAVNPTGASDFAGVSGTALLTMGAWALVVGLSVVALQRQKPLQLFKVMGLRANPVITLIAVILAVGSLTGGNPALHHVRELKAAADVAPDVTDRPSAEKAFESWLALNAACGEAASPETAPAALRVRPMILVAAEGGGIRAASWTVRAFEKVSAAGPCGKTAVMASSGVSGGSLGLTLSHLYGASEAMAKMKVLAKPGPLGSAVAGALMGDVVGSGTGLLIPTRFPDPATGQELVSWNDRAGLVESLWEEAAGSLASPFDDTIAGPTGALLLNSTDTGSGCRVVISQLDLPGAGKTQPAGPASGLSCIARQGFPLSVDLLDQQAQCPLQLRWSTAAMLSARFPIISPAGRVPAVVANAKGETECQMQSGFQLIDGGYSEGSALGTLNDLWPALQEQLLAHNSCVLSIAARPAGEELPGNDPCATIDAKNELVIPVFLFLQNSPGADIVARPPQVAPELLVPLIGSGAKDLQIGSAAWIQRLDAEGNVCPGTAADNACVAATAGVRNALGNSSVIVVAPNSVPALAAPLGWSLSNMSQQQLETAMNEEADTSDAGAMQPFAKLLAYLGG